MKYFTTAALLLMSSCAAVQPAQLKLMTLKNGPVLMSTGSSGTIISASSTDGRTMSLPWMKNAQKVDVVEEVEKNRAIALVSMADKCKRHAVIIFSEFGAAAEETGACDSEVRLSKNDTDILVVNDTDFSVYRVSGTELVKVRGPASRDIKNKTPPVTAKTEAPKANASPPSTTSEGSVREQFGPPAPTNAPSPSTTSEGSVREQFGPPAPTLVKPPINARTGSRPSLSNLSRKTSSFRERI